VKSGTDRMEIQIDMASNRGRNNIKAEPQEDFQQPSPMSDKGFPEAVKPKDESREVSGENGIQGDENHEDTEDENEVQDDEGSDDSETEKELPAFHQDKFTWKSGIQNLEPLDTIEKMFEHMLEKIMGDDDFNQLLGCGKAIRIGTMCSGTECPIIAMELIQECKILLDNPDKPSAFDALVHKKLDENAVASQENDRPVPSKRLTGTEYQNQKTRELLEESSEFDPEPQLRFNAQKVDHFEVTFEKFGQRKGNSKIKRPEQWQLMTRIVLEMFDFARVVVDEFPYADKNKDARRSIIGLSARAKWLLSGTPPLHDFAHIKSMAELIGVNLGIHDYTSMPTDVFREAFKDKTGKSAPLLFLYFATLMVLVDTEKFLIYQPPPSPFWVKRRDEVVQKFLDQYLRKVRKNPG
jgi:hypothetical protein